MEVMWLGQGGLLFASGKKKILIDPYLSDSLRKLDRSFKRRFKPNKKLFRVVPDIIVLTNSHPDHMDFKTLARYLAKKTKTKITVLSCENAFRELVETKECVKGNHIMFGEGDEWTLDNLILKAVKARTDDRSAFGLTITDSTDGRVYYIASNTLYNEAVIESAPKEAYASFIPVCGAYGCMNMTDAIRFGEKLESEFIIPIDYGMFDTINASKEFIVGGKVVPRPFKPIEFNLLPVQSLFTPKVFDSKFNEKVKKKKKGKDKDETETTEPVTTEPKTTVTEPKTTVTEPKTTVTEPRTTVTEPRTPVTEPKTEVDTTTVKPPLVETVTQTPKYEGIGPVGSDMNGGVRIEPVTTTPKPPVVFDDEK